MDPAGGARSTGRHGRRTKLFTQANELAILVEGCHLIAPMPWSAVLEREMSALPDDGCQLPPGRD
jgi:hypothetical protein